MGTDFSFFSQQVAVGSGKDDAGWYERVYLGLKKPRTYLWGSTGEARLGSLSDIAARTRAARMSFVRKVEKPMNVSDWFNGTTPAPVQGTSTPNKGVPADRASMVDLQAGGWSFAARDSKGGVWVWGELGKRELWSNSQASSMGRRTMARTTGKARALLSRRRPRSLSRALRHRSPPDAATSSSLTRTISSGK